VLLNARNDLSPRIYLSELVNADCLKYSTYLGFEVITAVVMKSPVFWNIRPCSSLKVNRRFGGKCCLHLQDLRINQERNQHESGGKQSFSTDYAALYSRR
jgi:hypothetical protein